VNPKDTAMSKAAKEGDRAIRITPDTDSGAGVTITINLHPSNLDGTSRKCAP
jgi:hypothetical protein